jgi:hypothetical protein
VGIAWVAAGDGIAGVAAAAAKERGADIIGLLVIVRFKRRLGLTGQVYDFCKIIIQSLRIREFVISSL